MTTFGIIWLLISIVAIAAGKKYAVMAIFVSATFQATSFANFSDKGISLFLVTELLVLFRYSGSIFNRLSTGLVRKISLLMVVFFIYSALISIISPGIFYDTIVINNDNSAIDGGARVSISVQSFIYLAVILLNILTAIAVMSDGKNISNNDAINIAINSAIIVSVFGFLEMAMKLTGTYDVLRELVFNNAGYKQALFADANGNFRLQGGFSEPSYCGAFLGASFWLSIFNRKYISSAIIGIALLLNFSGTGFIAFVSGGILFYAYNIKSKKILLSTIVISMAIFVIAMASDAFDAISGMVSGFVTGKVDSDSGSVRFAEAKIMIESIVSTYGLGIGLGITRGGGFALNLIASTGVFGFCMISWCVLNILKRSPAYWKIFFYTLMSAMIVSIPDLSFPILWASIILFLSSFYISDNRFPNFVYKRWNRYHEEKEDKEYCGHDIIAKS